MKAAKVEGSRGEMLMHTSGSAFACRCSALSPGPNPPEGRGRGGVISPPPAAFCLAACPGLNATLYGPYGLQLVHPCTLFSFCRSRLNT